MQVILFVLIFIVLLSAAYAGYLAAPWMPTKGKDTARMISAAQLKPGDKIYDLGCGDGRLLLAAAGQGAKAVGYELFILIYLVSLFRSWRNKAVSVRYGDFFRANLSDADVVFFFLLPKCYDRLIKKLETELKPGARVVVYCFEIEKWRDKLIRADKPETQLGVYSYQI